MNTKSKSKRQRERLICATVYTKGFIAHRRYCCVESAVQRFSLFMLLNAPPKATAEIYHDVTGKTLALIKVHAKGKIEVTKLWEKE